MTLNHNYNRQNKTLIIWNELDKLRSSKWIIEFQEVINNRVMIVLEEWQQIWGEYTRQKISVPEWTKVTFITPNEIKSTQVRVDLNDTAVSKTYGTKWSVFIENAIQSYNKDVYGTSVNQNITWDAINRNIRFWAKNIGIGKNAVNHHTATYIQHRFQGPTLHDAAINARVTWNAKNIDSKWAAINENIQWTASNIESHYTSINEKIQWDSLNRNTKWDSLQKNVKWNAHHENIWWSAISIWIDWKLEHTNIWWEVIIDDKQATWWKKYLPNFLRPGVPYTPFHNKNDVDRWHRGVNNYPWR